MLDRSLEEMRATLPTTVARLVGVPTDVFEAIDVVAVLSASAKLLRPRGHFGVELVGVVERGHDHVSTLPPTRVIAVVPNDPASNGVVVWIHHGHAGSIRLPGIAGPGSGTLTAHFNGAPQSAIGGRMPYRVLCLRIRRDRVPRLVQQCTNQRAWPDGPKHQAGRADAYPLRPPEPASHHRHDRRRDERSDDEGVEQ